MYGGYGQTRRLPDYRKRRRIWLATMTKRNGIGVSTHGHGYELRVIQATGSWPFGSGLNFSFGLTP